MTPPPGLICDSKKLDRSKVKTLSRTKNSSLPTCEQTSLQLMPILITAQLVE